MKYVNQLSLEDWAAIYQEMFPCAVFDEDKIQVTSNSDNDTLEVIFSECWEDDENGEEYLDTRYTFSDFDPPECLDCNYKDAAKQEMKSGFFMYMFTHFGPSYMKDFIYDKTNVILHLDGEYGLKKL